MRSNQRRNDEFRSIEFIRGFTKTAAGSVLVRAGQTHVLCTASIVPGVPEWRVASGAGWVTAEYDMLPGATPQRRERRRSDGRTQEIQRLIGRSLRAVTDMSRLGSNTIYLDCDVLQADGGTRTASITGAYIALCDAVTTGERRGLWGTGALTAAVAAISVGVVRGEVLVDLDYSEDSSADVDCNLVQTDRGEWIEVQATGERTTYSDASLEMMLAAGRVALRRLFELQRTALSA